MYINWDNLNTQLKAYGKNPPFDHAVIDDFFDSGFASNLADDFPGWDSEIWHRYENPLEVKKVCNNWNVFPESTYAAFSFLNSSEFTDYISSRIFPDTTLYADSGLNGGGWHIHTKGGKLNTHLDYSIHPKLGLQRKLNIIVYMNPRWREEWGGELGLWGNESSERPGKLVSSIWPKFNRAVIFDTTQNSWHGLPDPISCPEHEARMSLAVYYLCEPSSAANNRGKALFFPTKEQEGDDQILELIRTRSETATASLVYRK